MKDGTIRNIYFSNTEKLEEPKLAESCLNDLLGQRGIVQQQNRLSEIIGKQLNRNQTIIMLQLMEAHV